MVLDTNVFVGGGFNPESASAELIEAVRQGRLRMAWSEDTRAETRRVLEKIPPLGWAPVAALFRVEDRVEPSGDLSEFEAIEDPTDRKFAAVAAEADALLVTSDRHLLEPASRGDLGDGIPEVCTPGAWRRRLG